MVEPKQLPANDMNTWSWLDFPPGKTQVYAYCHCPPGVHHLLCCSDPHGVSHSTARTLRLAVRNRAEPATEGRE